MSVEPSLKFKIATEDWEFEVVHRLNYKTFVEEIPQHTSNPEQRLGERVSSRKHLRHLPGWRSARGNGGLDEHAAFFPRQQSSRIWTHIFPMDRRALEVRLLSVEKAYRNGFVFSRLVGLIAQHFKDLGYDLAIISGTVRQLRLYKHLGFIPFLGR